MTNETILNKLKESGFNQEVLKIFEYGSKVYGNNDENSDDDFVVILKSDDNIYEQIESPEVDIHIISLPKYQKMLDEHHIMALECYFSDDSLNPTGKFKLDKEKLRKEISGKSSNSWVKAKKKMTLEEEDSHIGLKSLYHSIRILDFGIQIAETGQIYNWKGNFHNFMKDNEVPEKDKYSWDYWDNRLKELYKDKKHYFKTVCPKTPNIKNKRGM